MYVYYMYVAPSTDQHKGRPAATAKVFGETAQQQRMQQKQP